MLYALMALRFSMGGDAYSQFTETSVLWPFGPTDLRYVPFRLGQARGILRIKAVGAGIRLYSEVVHELYIGNLYAYSAVLEGLSLSDPGFIDLDASSGAGRTVQRDYIRRAYFEYQSRYLAIAIGRRVLNWSTTFFWTPLNIFTPQNNLSVVPDDVPFSDCAFIGLRPAGPVSVELAYSPPSDNDSSLAWKAGMRTLCYLPGLDLVFEGGYDKGDSLVGAGFSTNLLGGALRAEACFYASAEPRYVLNYDRMFPGQVYLMAEYYHNGRADPTGYGLYSFYERDYIGLLISKSYDVVWSLAFYGVLCASDGSLMAMPLVRRAFGRGFEARLGAYYFYGRDTEISSDSSGLPIITRGDYFGDLEPGVFAGVLMGW
ncbi:MAG: hypothetical protein ABIM74_00025 [candidate division WOR-3 bacterium]